MSDANETKQLPPFQPPTQQSIDERLRPEEAEAKDRAKKIVRGKVSKPAAFKVVHDAVGPWAKDEVVTVKQVLDHIGGEVHNVKDEARRDECVNRLIELGAFIPYTEPE